MPQRLPKLSIVLAALLPSMLVLGIWLGGHPRWLPDPVADALLGDGPRAVSEGLDIVGDRFYRKVDSKQLSNAALDGVVKSLDDRFSNYFSPQEYGAFQDSIENRFTGIGVSIRRAAKGLTVVSVFEGSPADKAGLRVGDVITQVGGRKLAGRPEQAAAALVKGPNGSKATLRVLRGKRTFTRTLTRREIRIPVVESEIKRAKGDIPVAHIALSTFSPQDADDQVTAAIRKAKQRKAKAIVLDLRANGGGLITQAQLIASMFLKDGPIVTTRGRAVEERTLNALGEPIAGTLPVVVLVDGGTASASEIVTGALQDRKRATVVGTKTFGKGVFQEVLPLSNGGALDITVGQYFLPSGRNLGGKPIKPDVPARDDPDTPKRDEALDKAISVLASKL